MSNCQNLSDNELIVFLRKGDAAAYTEIYDRYFQLMFVFAYKKLRDEELAKDFVQELFVKVWEKKDTVSDSRNLSGYLYVALRNRMLDYFRREKLGEDYIEFLAKYADSYTENTDYGIREKQLAKYIDKQIENLPARMRHIFQLSRRDYLSHREIATVLETTENNVATQISSAVRILKGKLNRILIFMFV